ELTRQLLAFSRRQPLQPKITDLDDLIGKTARLLTQVLGENIRLNVQLEPNVGSILVDEAQMESALINMAVNARDAMPDGGKGTIFKLYFPCREAAAAQGSVDGVRHDLAPAARTELILTVDDSPTVLATAVLQLEALGYQTLTARNAETALEMLDRDTKVDVL